MHCDNSLISAERVYHNTLLFTVPLDEFDIKHEVTETSFIYFCSDDTVEEVALSLYQKYEASSLDISLEDLKMTLHRRKLKYDEDLRFLSGWEVWGQGVYQDSSSKYSSGFQIPQVFHFVWLGVQPLPLYAKSNIESWSRIHPFHQIEIWADADIIEGVPLENYKLFQRLTDPRARSDIVRLELLRRYGGVYIDVDITPLRKIKPIVKNVSSFAILESPDVVNNAVLAALPRLPFFQRLLRDLPAWTKLHNGRET